MKQLLKWIEKEGFVLHSERADSRNWYSPKRLRKPPSIYYTHKELIELFKKETQ